MSTQRDPSNFSNIALAMRSLDATIVFVSLVRVNCAHINLKETRSVVWSCRAIFGDLLPEDGRLVLTGQLEVAWAFGDPGVILDHDRSHINRLDELANSLSSTNFYHICILTLVYIVTVFLHQSMSL